MLNARYERVQSDLTHGAPYFLSFLKTNIAVGNHQWQKYIRTACSPFGKQDCQLSNDATVTLLSARRQYNKLCGRPSQYVPPLQVDLWPFDLESGVRVTCDVGYLCANFSLPRPLCSRLRPDVRDRQTDVRQTSDALHRLMPPTLGAGA